MKDGLTILSFGAGQDSTAILYSVIYSPEFRRKHVKGTFHVIFSDTGDEHPETYDHLAEVQQLCLDHKIGFTWIEPEMGYHSNSWNSLRDHYRKYNVVMMVSGRKSCTDQLKIRPIYKFINESISEWNGVDPFRKKALIDYAETYGKVRVLLGIAKGEEKRVQKSGGKEPKWQQRSVTKHYPLIEEGWDRQACQEVISSYGHEVPLPSNCMLCPFMSGQELLWLYRTYPGDFWEWVDLEKNKVIANLGREKNHGALGEAYLEDQLAKANEKYGHMSTEELNEYKMSHGHCVMSKY